jgi:4-amino-4-deoxy-L-arabinose transferase-like glycosyltransferase
MGDWNLAELERLKTCRFTCGSIEGIRYESHQPPLYYLLAVPIFLVSHGDLLALRLLSVILSLGTLLTIYALGRLIFPGDADIALVASGVVAFIPMHVAISASVNNDTLAELLLSLITLVSLARLKGDLTGGRYILLAGFLMGLGLLTKVTVYVGFALLIVAEIGRVALGQQARHERAILLPIAGIALALALPWFVRNAITYGDLDILARTRHDLVVVGQPRTVLGLPAVHYFVVTTFQSFWGVFGWMGVFLDIRLYGALAIITALTLSGLALWTRTGWHTLRPVQRWALGILALLFFLVLVGMVQYNLTFIQAQGRYLFPASAAVGIALALGWRSLAQRPLALAVGLLLGGLVLFALFGGLRLLALSGTIAGMVIAIAYSMRGLATAAINGALPLLLAILSVVSLEWYLVPGLR